MREIGVLSLPPQARILSAAERAACSHTPHMERRRSSRRAAAPATKALKSSVELGLRSLLDADDNANVVAKMLDVPTDETTVVVDGCPGLGT